MNYLDIALAARAHCAGSAQRSAVYCHRRLNVRPMVIVAWQLGAEPFTAAAIGFGTDSSDVHLVVAGEPRNRDLAFDALLEFAHWFNPRFEANVSTIDGGDRCSGHGDVPVRDAPQVVVANGATIEMLGRLGRRLAYLPTTGANVAHPALVRLGRHLQFFHRHAALPGQQLVVSMADTVASHWATSLSMFEEASLAALDAFVDPPAGMHGFHAVEVAELRSVGPVPDGDEDALLEPLLDDFNHARSRSTERTVVEPLLVHIRAHYEQLVRRTWKLIWRCMQREQCWPEAPSVGRRWQEDVDAFVRHMEWMAVDGRRRTRETVRQAAMTRRRLEDARERLRSEEALDDPVRMIPYLLDQKAVEGTVLQVDTWHREVAKVRPVARPLVTIASSEPCLMPVGRELWWTERAKGKPWVVVDVAPAAGGGSVVTLKLTTSQFDVLPVVGEVACFSIHHQDRAWQQQLPEREPWTHRSSKNSQAPQTLEEVA